ncbi:GNAT family N-acetyltransferase [Shewanella aestuarii]|uniref:GNAT family N-acetyltransferase n=1 Tax=Shewanella aestuarii TaxID=1028752 RepID=A0A6G9QIL9_9GAMM|nr:GNAT family N-acetyltransferase [Shewanella aestuarii]QIR14390.1 GNAT family N-acetyltransferase [Shewanella aestuarii]
MQIRLAIQADLKPLCHLLDLYRQEQGYESDLAACFNFLNQRLAEKDSIIFLAIDELGIVGFVQIYPAYCSLMLNTSWKCADLYVLPAYRQQGIADEMLTKAKMIAQTANIDLMLIDN